MELIVALDVDSISPAEKIVKLLKHKVKIFKVGSKLFTAVGPAILEILNSNGCKVFLDLKYHDIPTVVSDAVMVAGEKKVFAVSLHISGGKEMLEKCISLKNRPLLWGITVLTSLDDNDLKEIGISQKIEAQVELLTKIAKDVGLDGIVCSPREIDIVKKISRLQIIVPGIRLAEETDDQKRTLTPKEAKEKGADYIVVGRPIIKAENPLLVTEKTLEEIK
ncbi:MAG: orotidine-5'-phosphate decarboxylase [Elusimicrobiota bacterium]